MIYSISQVFRAREVRDQYVNVANPPASTLVEGRRLARDDFLIEVEAVAVLNGRAIWP